MFVKPSNKQTEISEKSEKTGLKMKKVRLVKKAKKTVRWQYRGKVTVSNRPSRK